MSRPEPSKPVQNAIKTNNAPTKKAPSATADLLSLSEPAAPASQPQPPQQNSTLLSISATTTKQDDTADVSSQMVTFKLSVSKFWITKADFLRQFG